MAEKDGDDPLWTPLDEEWFTTSLQKRLAAQARRDAEASAARAAAARKVAEAEARREALLMEADARAAAERKERAKAARVDEIRERVQWVRDSINDEIRACRRELVEEERLRARCGADLAEAQVAVLDRCPACGRPVVEPDAPRDDRGASWHPACRRP